MSPHVLSRPRRPLGPPRDSADTVGLAFPRRPALVPAITTPSAVVLECSTLLLRWLGFGHGRAIRFQPLRQLARATGRASRTGKRPRPFARDQHKTRILMFQRE